MGKCGWRFYVRGITLVDNHVCLSRMLASSLLMIALLIFARLEAHAQAVFIQRLDILPASVALNIANTHIINYHLN